MEETKDKKEVKLTVSADNTEKKSNKNPRKHTYEELNEICGRLYQENQNLVKQLQQVSNFTMFKRLDYLFRIVELSDKFNDESFINMCTSEIKDAIIASEQEEQQNN